MDLTSAFSHSKEFYLGDRVNTSFLKAPPDLIQTTKLWMKFRNKKNLKNKLQDEKKLKEKYWK